MRVAHGFAIRLMSLARPAALMLAAALFLGGCANARHYRGLDLSTTQPSSLIPVPTAAQGGNNDCGYAAFASVALYHRVAPSRLVEGPVFAKFRGPRLSAQDLVEMAKMLDLTAFGYQGALDDLRDNIAKGRPVVVLLDHPPRLGNYPSIEFFADLAAAPFKIPHWVVVVGFSADDRIILHDPRNGLVSMSPRDFDRLWEKSSRMSVLVVKQ